uniref:Uncharacterized protein n=1 Tax=Octopus bimaculoides TaxID=37653 RepID=A0A0L8HNS1_OCTBM
MDYKVTFGGILTSNVMESIIILQVYLNTSECAS